MFLLEAAYGLGFTHQEDITLINIYAPNQGAPKYVKQLLTGIKRETDENTVVVGNLNTPQIIQTET